jgi:hypothetical protein
MAHPDQRTRHDYNPQREVWRLSNRDVASLAILKEPAKKSVHHASRGLSASNAFDLVPGNGKGSYDRLGLPHCEEGINRAPARIIALNNGTSDHSSDGCFSSVYCHKVPLAAKFTNRLPALGSSPGCADF